MSPADSLGGAYSHTRGEYQDSPSGERYRHRHEDPSGRYSAFTHREHDDDHRRRPSVHASDYEYERKPSLPIGVGHRRDDSMERDTRGASPRRITSLNGHGPSFASSASQSHSYYAEHRDREQDERQDFVRAKRARLEDLIHHEAQSRYVSPLDGSTHRFPPSPSSRHRELDNHRHLSAESDSIRNDSSHPEYRRAAGDHSYRSSASRSPEKERRISVPVAAAATATSLNGSVDSQHYPGAPSGFNTDGVRGTLRDRVPSPRYEHSAVSSEASLLHGPSQPAHVNSVVTPPAAGRETANDQSTHLSPNPRPLAAGGTGMVESMPAASGSHNHQTSLESERASPHPLRASRDDDDQDSTMDVPAAAAARLTSEVDDELLHLAGQDMSVDDELERLGGRSEGDRFGSERRDSVDPAAQPSPSVPATTASGKKSKKQKKEASRTMTPEALERWQKESWPTKGLLNKDGSLRKKPGPPKGTFKGVKKPPTKKALAAAAAAAAAATAEAATMGESSSTPHVEGDIRHQALLNATGLAQDGSIAQSTEAMSEDGSVGPSKASPSQPPTTAAATTKKKKKKSQAASRASSPITGDWMSEPGTHVGSDVDNDLEDMLTAPDPPVKSKAHKTIIDGQEHTSHYAPSQGSTMDPYDPYDYDDDDDQQSQKMVKAENGDAVTEPVAAEPEPTVVRQTVRDILQEDQPDVVVTEKVARARCLKAEILRAAIWKDIVSTQVPQVYKLSLIHI